MKTLIMILQLLPVLIEAVRSVEALLPLSGFGKEKLEFVLGIVEDTHADVEDIQPIIIRIIMRIVGLANATGIFKTK